MIKKRKNNIYLSAYKALAKLILILYPPLKLNPFSPTTS